MRIKRKSDILIVTIVLLFFSTLVVSYISNNYAYTKTLELVNVSKRIDFITSLRTSLARFEESLDTNLSSPNAMTNGQLLKAADQFFTLVGKAEDFAMDEEQSEMMTFLRKNIPRFHAIIEQILSSQNHDDKVVLFQTLRADLFERVAKDIDKYWFENFEKIGKAKDTAGKARKHSRYAVLVSFTLLVISAMVMRTMIMKKIVTPILDISHMSYRMAKGDLDLEIKLSSRDELQELSHNFNFMAASLKEKMKSLEASVEKEQRVVRELAILNEFTASVSSDLDLKSALQRFIEKTKDLMKAEIGAILFIQSDGMKSFLSTDSLIFEPTIARLLTYEAKDIGTVMREQIVSYKNDLALSLSDGRVIRNFMTLPLYSTTGIQCLLTVINTRTGFDQEQEDSLINFAFQAFQTLALQNEVVKLATTDGLTGLFNHRTFQNRLSEEILRGQRYQKSFVLILIDIDHFKHFNDTYGHQTGDDVLKTIAMIIRGSIRSVDFPARYGGEEFVVLLPESVCEHAFLVADRIRTSIIEHPFCFKDGEKASLSVSAGISCFPSDAIKKEDLIKMADSALYYAKNQGRNRVSLYRETLAH